MMKIALTISFALFIAGVLDSGQANGAGGRALVIIINKDNPVTSVSHRDIENIFLGKRSLWSWGGIIKKCDLAEPYVEVSKSARAVFSRRYLGKDLMVLKSYWIKMIFSGKSQPPVSFDKVGDVIKFVSGNKSAIGYVYSYSVTDKVKRLKVTGAAD